jgi:hypothetical protein
MTQASAVYFRDAQEAWMLLITSKIMSVLTPFVPFKKQELQKSVPFDTKNLSLQN